MFIGLRKVLEGRRAGRVTFATDERGVTAIEFGLLAFPFFTIVAGILQTSVIFLATQVLESAVNDAARQIRTGQFQLSSGTIETFRSTVCDRLFGLFPDCANLYVRVNDIGTFGAATISPPVDPDCEPDECDWTEAEQWTPGTGRSTIMVEVYYRYPVLIQFGPLGMANMPDGSRLLGTATVFKNEPFQ